MASTIQIKRGTGSAVPSGLADGELAINLDKGQLYFGSGSTSVNSFTFKNLTAENYIVSSSVTHLTTQTLSGSTTFGDDAVDIHNRTGSFNISGALTVGKDDIGHDVKFYGAASGRVFHWDESENKLSVPTLDVSLNINGSGTIQGTTITATTAFAPDTQDGASLGTDSLQFSDVYLADGGKLSFGDDNDTSLTHVHNVGLLLNANRQLQFRDSGINLKSSADGHFEINSDTTLDITAPTVDINASTEVTIDTDTLTISSANSTDPLVTIKNTTNDANGARLRFVKDKGAAGADNDVVGLIEFYGDDDNQDQVLFAKIETSVLDASNGGEEGKLTLNVASHDGELQPGITVSSGITEDLVDVTIGNGSTSTTTIVGDLVIEGRDINSATDSDLRLNSDTNISFMIDADDDGTNSFKFYNSSTEIANLDKNGNLQIDGDLTVSGNDIKDDDGTTCITFDSSGNTTIANTLNASLTGNVTGNASGLSSTLVVSSGGTGATSFADKSVIITQDSGTDTLAAVAMSTNGQLLIGGTSGPAVAVPTGGDGLTVTVGDGTLEYDLDAALTTVTSILATDLKIGEDDQTKIDFETANEIHFYANNVEQIYLADNIFGPQSDSDVDLGTTGVRWKDAFVDSMTSTGAITAGGVITGTGFTAGNAVIAEAELELLDGLTAGTAIASKVVTTDANIDTTGQRNLTISGELDAATGDFSGAVDIAGDLTLSAGGDGALTFAANSSIKIADNHATSLVIEEADTAYMTFKTTNSTELITANKGFNIAGAFQIGGTAVTSTAAELNILDGVTSTAAELNILDGVTSTAAELNALDGITAVVGELNALDIGSTAVGTAVASKAVILDSNKDYTGIRNLTISGELDAATGDFSGDVDIAGTTNLDAVDIDGNVQLDGTFTVGVDDTGYDVTLFGATANRKAVFDASQDHLKLYDNTKLVLGTGADAAGFDSSLYHDGSNLYLTNTTGDIILSDTTVKITAGTAGDANLILQSDTDDSEEADNPFMLLEQDGGVIRSIIGHAGADDEYPDATVFTGGLNNHLIIAHSGSGATRGMQFGTGNNARVTINTDGEVGIGTNNPGKTLDVTGEIRASGDITANGNIVGDDSTNITNISSIECDSLVHDGDTDTKLTFGADSIRFTAGNNVVTTFSSTLISNNLPSSNGFSISGTNAGDIGGGDIVYFGGTTSMTTGAIYHYKSDGTWELADADDNTKSDGLLGVALGAASDTNGVLLRGMVTLDHDPGAVGEPIYLTTTAGDASSTAPSGNGNIVRIIGYCLHATAGNIWFNPDSTFVEVNA